MQHLPLSKGLCGLAWITKKELPVGARQKLNSVYFGIAAFIAGFVGLASKSLWVFVICLAGLVAAMFHDGSLRGNPRGRR